MSSRDQELCATSPMISPARRSWTRIGVTVQETHSDGLDAFIEHLLCGGGADLRLVQPRDQTLPSYSLPLLQLPRCRRGTRHAAAYRGRYRFQFTSVFAVRSAAKSPKPSVISIAVGGALRCMTVLVAIVVAWDCASPESRDPDRPRLRRSPRRPAAPRSTDRVAWSGRLPILICPDRIVEAAQNR